MNSRCAQALEQMQAGEHAQALAAMQQLPTELTSKGEVKLAIAECLLETQQFELAETQLATIPLEYQDNYYKGLVPLNSICINKQQTALKFKH